MVTEELLSYIKRQQANHVPEESIRAILLSNGWLKIDVDKAFDSLFKVQESAVVTSKDFRTKVASFSASSQPASSSSVGIGAGSTGDVVSQPQNSLLNDSYREPIDNTPKEQFTSKNLGTSMGAGLPDDLKERLKKISGGSIFAPQKEIVNPVTSSSEVHSNPLIALHSEQTQTAQSFEERLNEPVSAPAERTSSFPIKRETVMSQPLSSLHMIENRPVLEPAPDQNRLYSRFGGGSPYSPSMDKFNNPLVSTPVKKSHSGIIVFLIFILGLGGGGYYLYTYKPALVRSFIDSVVSKINTQEKMIQVENLPESPQESSGVPNSTETQNTGVQNNESQNTQNTPPVSGVPLVESTLKSIAQKVPSYVGAKSTIKGVCSNISSGIAKDIISLKQTYGATVSCVDDANGFSISVPYQPTDFVCIDATQEIVLIQSASKTARCIQ